MLRAAQGRRAMAPVAQIAAFAASAIMEDLDLIGHPCDPIIEIFPILDEVGNDPDDTGRQHIGTCS